MPSINAVPLEGNSQESSRSPTRSRVLPSKCGFKLASLNINKLTTHLDELKIFLVSNDIDVLAFNETKLNEYITDNEVSISGYDIVRRDRTTYGGGGVCFYVKKSINFSVRNDLCMGSLENLCIEIRKPRSKSFIVATWYRPPNSLVSIFSPFEELIGKLDSLNTEFYLLGDLNCNMAASQFDSDTRKLLTITDVYGLQQLITEPTRITETSATWIDLIFTNCPDKVLCSGVRLIGISDHSMVYVYLNNRVFLSRNYRLIVAPRKFDVLKTNICPRSEASRANMLVLRTPNFQGATIRPIVPRHKHSIVFIVHY